MKKFILINFTVLHFFFFIDSYSRDLIILNSIPKCGTHLASKCIELLTGKKCYNIRWNPNVKPEKFFYTGDDIVDLKNKFSKITDDEFISSHLTYSSIFEDEVIKNKGYKFIFIYRDPRAQVVSMARWKIKFNANNGMDLNDTIMSLINDSVLYRIGWKDVGNIFDLYKSFMPWALSNNKFLSIRFEDLVGPMGGGDSDIQYKTVCRMAKFLGVKIGKRKIEEVINKLFGGTATFNEGQISGWKKYFTNQHKKEFKNYAGQLLIDLDYEKDFNW